MSLNAHFHARRSRIHASRLIATFALALGCLVARPAFADDAKPAGASKPADTTAYNVKRIYKAGEVDRYKLDYHMTLNIPQLGGDTEIVMQMVMKETTKEVKSDGVVISVDEYEQGTVNIGGMDMDLTGQLPKLTITHGKKPLDVKAEGGNEMISGQLVEMVRGSFELQDAVYPAKPVKIGDTWKIEVSSPSAHGDAIKTAGDVTFLGAEVVDGKKTWTVKSRVKSADTSPDNKMQSETTSLLDAANGKPLKVTSSTDGVTGGNKVNAKMTMTMMPSTEKKPETPAKAVDADKKPTN